jgi:anaerobic ribonucleoside-triphosphate reductase
MKPSIDCPFVSFAKLEESIDVFKKWSQIRDQQIDENIKKPLIEDKSEELIKLQIEFKKIPFNRTTFIHTISLPNHWRHESDFESCLIVKDINKKPLTDRELDLGFI